MLLLGEVACWLYYWAVRAADHAFLEDNSSVRCCRVGFRLRYWAVRAADHAEARKPANSAWLRERTLDDAG